MIADRVVRAVRGQCRLVSIVFLAEQSIKCQNIGPSTFSDVRGAERGAHQPSIGLGLDSGLELGLGSGQSWGR